MTKKVLVILAVLAVAAGAYAQNQSELNDGNPNSHKFMVHGNAKPDGAARSQNLTNHGGPVIVAPKLVFIFWGFGSGNSYTSTVQNFRNSGINSHILMLAQYSSAGTAAPASMGGSANDKFDSSTPPVNVTDATVQAEVKKYFAGAEDASTVYHVFIPATSYSSDGTSTSCGGPHLAYCAYHGHFTDGSHDVKYAIEPYPSCSGCQSSGFNDNQNLDHFVIHESREAISDPDLNAWYDRSGNEADDKCAWSPAPFIVQSTGFGYQYEWSNSAGGCVQQ
jgi:hypothetical protein